MRMTGRRWFLGGLATAAATGGGIWADIRRLVPALITSVCKGDPGMPKKILVACATRTGSTGAE
jgi:hypothetical protein